MVFLHTMRSFAGLAQGIRDRKAVFRAHNEFLKATGGSPILDTISGEQLLPISIESKCTMYMGLRMTDVFGHINNARYVEAMELARWREMGTTGIWRRTKRAGLFPVISGINVQYLKEIKPFTTVVIRSRFGSMPKGGKALQFHQQIENIKGDVIHATGVLRFAWLNAPSYRNPDGSKPKAGTVVGEEAVLRLGYPQEDVNKCMIGYSGSAWDGNDQYFGVPVSAYDNKLKPLKGPVSGSVATEDPELVALHHQLSMNNTFPQSIIETVDASDSQWRGVLRAEAKERKELLSSKMATPMNATVSISNP